MSRRRRKYGNKKKVIDGIKFDSIAEATYYSQMKMLKRAGEIRDFKMQVEYPLIERFEHPTRKRKSGKPSIVRGTSLIVDFVITDKDGKEYVIDVKGMRTPVFNIKAKIFMVKYNETIYLAKRRGKGFVYEEA